MNEVAALIKKLDREHRIYLEQYFADAPFWLMDAFQAVRLPKNRTFITEDEKAEESIFLKADRGRENLSGAL